MTSRKLRLTALGILLLLALALAIDLPAGPNLQLGGWFREIKVHLGLDLKGGSRLIYDADLSKVPTADHGSALEGVRDVIERRVNLFGVSEPLVQTSRAGGQERIIVELAGIQDVNQAITLIGETPLLEFKELGAPKPLTDDERQTAEAFNTAQKQKAEEALRDAQKPAADFSVLAAQYSDDSSKDTGGDIGFQERETLVAPYADMIFDALKVGEISSTLVESQFGYHIIKKTDQRETDRDGEKITEVRSSHILLRTQPVNPETGPETYIDTGLNGSHLKQSTVAFDPNTGAPTVLLSFNDEGKKLFGEITKRNLNKTVAIFLDQSLISSPVVQSEIVNGEAVISGSFTVPEAKQLAQRLNAGALPVPITLVNQQTVGPTLGRVSIERSLFAGLVGLVAVAVFMLAVYRLLGLVAVVSLFSYTLLALAIFKLWPVTLTLAGVAGFILSIGMAVDANILIFERIREELRAGRPMHDAVEEGFRRAWLSIRDSNVSSLITTFILAWFGTSIIKGFAITLSIGILVSMFSAITIARTILRLMVRQGIIRHPKLIGVERIAE